MNFPRTPFKLNESEKGDKELLNYLRVRDNFPYLDKSTYEKIDSIKMDHTKPNMQKHQQELIGLWPMILTDVLLRLKKNDTREWHNDNKHMGTFFDKKSLGIDELEEVFTGFSEFEGMMYGASPEHYRDHITHSFRVWIIGQGLLNECFNNKLSMNEKVELEISEMEWACMWTIVALCHDVGYPLSQIERINQKAQKTFRRQGLKSVGNMSFSFSDQLLPFHDSIIKLIASKPVRNGDTLYLTHLQNKYYLKLLKSFDKLDHGIISSLLISNALVYFLESDYSHDPYSSLGKEDVRQFVIRREILRSIAAHTCQDIYHLYFNTLSFLLYIVDEIQCWGRPTFMQLQQEHSLKESCIEVKEFNDKRIKLIITTYADKWDNKQIKLVSVQVGRLKKMLRLAVDTKKLIEKHFMHFEVTNKSGQKCLLSLDRGKIAFVEPKKL